LTVEDVVTKDKTNVIVTDKLLANDEGLRQTFGPWLLCVAEVYAKRRTVAQQTLELRQVGWR
jgi:hypothetical protein